MGWIGTILRINLSNGSIVKEPLHPQLARAYIGGRGLATKLLYDEIDQTLDPLGPANKLILATGPLTGTNAPTGGRYMVVTKSPLTGAIACSNSGGYVGAEMKYAGYDVVIVEGKAPHPVYLWINNDQVEIRDAAQVWGESTHKTEDALRAATSDEVKILGIGPAGETLSLTACIINDKHRAAGRSGVGAVMGSKNLKAVVFRGTRPVKIAHPQAFMQAAVSAVAKLKAEPGSGMGLPTYGTPGIVNVINAHGFMPTNNFQFGQFAGAERISGETIHGEILIRNKGCFACTIGCARVTKVKAGKFQGSGEGPEYETVWSLGAMTGVDDLAAVTKANYLCNELGMDTIEAGVAIATAMELFERGAIPEREIGRSLRFGDADALVEMTAKLGRGQGFGAALALGGARLAERYGHPELFMGVKGQAFPAYDGRGAQGIALGYATSNRGACHLRGYTISAEVFGVPHKVDPFAIEGKAALAKASQDATAFVDSTGTCVFTTFALRPADLHIMLELATDAGYTEEEVVKIGERIWNLERLFNLKAGISAKDDTLPRRILEEPIPAGPAKGKVARLGEMLPEYYRLRGWDPQGVPTQEKLKELALHPIS